MVFLIYGATFDQTQFKKYFPPRWSRSSYQCDLHWCFTAAVFRYPRAFCFVAVWFVFLSGDFFDFFVLLLQDTDKETLDATDNNEREFGVLCGLWSADSTPSWDNAVGPGCAAGRDRCSSWSGGFGVESL